MMPPGWEGGGGETKHRWWVGAWCMCRSWTRGSPEVGMDGETPSLRCDRCCDVLFGWSQSPWKRVARRCQRREEEMTMGVVRHTGDELQCSGLNKPSLRDL